jgi:hypothetical protein
MGVFLSFPGQDSPARISYHFLLAGVVMFPFS